MARKLKESLEQLNLFEDSKVNPAPEISPAEKLTEILPSFFDQKSEMDRLKKIVEGDGTKIKELMKEAGLNEFMIDDIKATRTVSEKQEFIEEALIEKIKQLGVKGIIKQREYVDMDALENAIYNGHLNAAALAGCQINKETITLRVTKVKKNSLGAK